MGKSVYDQNILSHLHILRNLHNTTFFYYFKRQKVFRFPFKDYAIDGPN